MNWKEILGLGTSGGLAAGPIGIAAGVGTGVLGSILGSKSQSEANKMNLQIARETNAANASINQANLQAQRENMLMQNQFNAEEAKKARDYSSPLQQSRMKLLAGINPLQDAGGSVTANMASGASPGIPSPIPMQVAHVEPVSNQLALVGQIIKDMSIASRSVNSNEKIAREANAVTKRGQDINEDISARDRAQNAFDAAALRDLQDMLSKRSYALAEKQISLAENGTWFEQMQAKQRDEQLLVDWYNAHTSRNTSDAQVKYFAAQTSDLLWTLNNLRPEEKKNVIAATQKLLYEGEKLLRENKFSDSTWNAAINKFIWSENIDRATSQLLDRSLRNLSNIDGKDWLLVINSLLSVFGGSGITPGYSVK